MQVLFDISSLSKRFTGIDRYICELAQRLPKHLPELKYLSQNKLVDSFDIATTPNKRLKTMLKKIVDKPPISYFSNVLASVYFGAKNNYQEKLLKNTLNTQTFIYHNPNYIIPKVITKPSVITIHDLCHIDVPQYQSEATNAYLNQYLPLSIAKASHIIAVSNYTKKRIIKYFGIGDDKVTTIYNGVSNIFKPYSASECDAILKKYKLRYKSFILSVGTIEGRKNIKNLLLAYDALSIKLKAQFPLVIVGKSGWKNTDIKHLLTKMLAKKEVIYLNHVTELELPLLYAAAKILAYLSYYEGFGLPIAESMSSGTLVVCSNSTAMPEVIGDAGFTVAPEDINKTTDVLEQALQTSEREKQMIQKGIERVKKFSWENCALETVKVYESIWRG